MFHVVTLMLALAGSSVSQPPSDAQIIRALPPVARGVPFIFEEFRDDILIMKSRVGESKVGTQVFIPLIGPARVIASNWQCEVFYKETVRVDFPFPFTAQKNRMQVIQIEKAEVVCSPCRD